MPGTRSSRSENSDGNELAELPGQRLPDEEAQIGGCRNSNNQGSVQLGHNNEEHDSQSEIGPDERLHINPKKYTVTMLAFIYVPLNLATSIFGMNIEQLNGNGQQVWVFILTAVVALTITGGSWFAIEQINSYRKWQRRSTEERYDGKTHFSLAVRLAMVALLLSRSRGHALWMLKSGAWWRIIVDHRSRYLGPHDSGKGSLTAGEYVSKYIRSQQHQPGGWVRPLFTLSIINKERWRRAPEEDE